MFDFLSGEKHLCALLPLTLTLVPRNQNKSRSGQTIQLHHLPLFEHVHDQRSEISQIAEFSLEGKNSFDHVSPNLIIFW